MNTEQLGMSVVSGRHRFLKSFICHLTLSAKDSVTGVALSNDWRKPRKENRMNRLLVCITCGALIGASFAQDPSSQPAVEDMPPEAKITSERGADEMMQEFMDSKGWNEGANDKEDGSPFVVQKGVGAIQAKPNSPNYNDARVRAFDKAMLDAKAKLAGYLETEISTAASYSYVEPPMGDKTADQELAEAIANQPDDSMLGKAKLLVNKKLDNLLKKEGYDADASRAQGKAKVDEVMEKLAKVTGKETYKRMVKGAAQTVISGAQAYYTVEAIEGSRAEIGVVLVWSPKLAEMASSLVTGKPITGAKPKTIVKRQINKDLNVLLSTFGVQQKIDENGEYVLVAYGQSGARTSKSASVNMAKSKARQNAQAMIRAFAGEAVAYSMAQDQAEETNDFGEDSNSDMRDQSEANRFISTASAKMKINGMGTVYSWNARHPISGRTVYGEVVTWKPSGAAIARSVKAKIESTAKDGAAGRRTASAPQASGLDGKAKPTATERVMAGSQGDEDAF